MSNGGYFQSEAGPAARKREIEELNEQYDTEIDKILNPRETRKEAQEIENSALFTAGTRGLDRLKWEFGGASAAQSSLEAQGL